ncbi:MAG: Trimethylamine corrinoid protein MtbC1 [Candidatus Methanohalarchaeum thermophilum]|uniref:Trimethylamine corrinoid protein MtbC1 n=1 Tax=Methanohalarchaeum thermophilum TaxID=1903181 RepID=A0A1Q6DX42_METT1|nr:MAG: Trimethylamine corrinoid protein MtbC1 [Candidatus Methanohalarchaeum thermophilum]
MTEKEIFEELHEAVVDMDEDRAVEAAEKALDEGVDPLDAIMEGLVKGIAEVGDLYDEGEMFVPEIMMASEALYSALDVLKPHIDEEEMHGEGKIIMAVSEGDVHDIGKNLVKLMIDLGGMEVIDLGKDVPLEKIVDTAEKEKADMIAVSAMMTSTMEGIDKLVDIANKQLGKNVKVMCGGAPITKETAENFGADGWAPNAVQAKKEALKLLRE